MAENTDVQIKFYQPKVISIKTTETDDNLTESDEIASGNTSVRSTDEEINPRRIYDIPQQKESPRVINPKRFLRYTKNISVVQPNRFTEKDLSVDPRQEPFGLSGLLLSLVTVFAIILFLGEALEIVPLIIIAASVGFISLIFGIISLIRIIRQPEKLKGYWVAIASISAGAVLLVFGGILFYLLNYFVF
ncbi:MAG: hypothetical protein R3277_11555 [Brumimicrobium sp.]|nr:hypothetical protein [Brumimicrobium sp.]